MRVIGFEFEPTLTYNGKSITMREYARIAYPRIYNPAYLIEHRDETGQNWNLYMSAAKLEDAQSVIRKQAEQSENQQVLWRALSVATDMLVVPVFDFMSDQDCAGNLIQWDGVWTEVERELLLDVLLQNDPKPYPAMDYPTWSFVKTVAGYVWASAPVQPKRPLLLEEAVEWFTQQVKERVL